MNSASLEEKYSMEIYRTVNLVEELGGDLVNALKYSLRVADLQWERTWDKWKEEETEQAFFITSMRNSK